MAAGKEGAGWWKRASKEDVSTVRLPVRKPARWFGCSRKVKKKNHKQRKKINK
jgi:hypothetical protein